MPHVLSTISFHSFPAAIEEAFRLTLLADSDPRPGRAGRKADRQASEAGMKAYMAYVLPFEQRFGILPTPEAVAAMDEMDWAEYAAGRQEPEQCDFFNLGVWRATLFRRFSLWSWGISGWDHRRCKWKTVSVFSLREGGGRLSSSGLLRKIASS